MKTRFLEKVTKTENCWRWTGALHKNGYGAFWDGAKIVKAHRASWELFVGPITDGLNVLHKCDNRNCVNPDHLFLGTQSDNLKDCVAKGRFVTANAAKTHCQYGHPLSGENLYITSKGYRNCRICKRNLQRMARGLTAISQKVEGE